MFLSVMLAINCHDRYEKDKSWSGMRFFILHSSFFTLPLIVAREECKGGQHCTAINHSIKTWSLREVALFEP
uniref:Uncharacterized protein n=1 Tax=Nelumbo nucifera TaxID=4432 RepID=A0A822ZC35_NELNU|nr:TPA_asm: hypothetical protein HUJ06_000323 [Nelumbo nucifera]